MSLDSRVKAPLFFTVGLLAIGVPETVYFISEEAYGLAGLVGGLTTFGTYCNVTTLYSRWKK